MSVRSPECMKHLTGLRDLSGVYSKEYGSMSQQKPNVLLSMANNRLILFLTGAYEHPVWRQMQNSHRIP